MSGQPVFGGESRSALRLGNPARSDTTDPAIALESERRRRETGERAAATPLTAWKCEACHKWVPMSWSSALIYVEEVGPIRSSLSVIRSASRYIRRMVVCEPCKRTIGGR